jgi:hypothetical protein
MIDRFDRLPQTPRVVFTLSDDEEKDLKESHGAVLKHRHAESAHLGENVALDGSDGVYVANIVDIKEPRPTESGETFESDREYVVRVIRWPIKRNNDK